MHRWFEGGEAPRNHDTDVERAAEELKQLGIPLEVMGEWAEPEPKREVSMLTLPMELRQSVQAFVACATQWDYLTPGLGKPIPMGLNYTKLESVLRLKGTPRRQWPEVFEDVRFMEAVALPMLAA